MKKILNKYLDQEITVDSSEVKLFDVLDNYFSVFFDGKIKMGDSVFFGGEEKRYYSYASIIKIVEKESSLEVMTINERNIDRTIIDTLKEMY